MKRIGVWCLLYILWSSAAQAQEVVTLPNPIAYIGHDYNLYLTDGTTTVPMTTDAALDEMGIGIIYAQPRWSHNGSQLVFFRETTAEGTAMMLAVSGEPIRELIRAPGADDTYFDNRVTAWSPDGAEIAFVGLTDEEFGLFAVSVEDGSVRSVIPPLGPSIGEGMSDDPALVLTAQERGGSPYRERYDFNWTEEGILLSLANSCICVQLLTPTGEVLDEWIFGSEILASVGDPFVVERDPVYYEEPPVLVDVSHPAEVPLELHSQAYTEVFMDGALYYVTRSDALVEIGNSDLQTGVPFEDQWMWGFFAESATLRLWRYNPGGDDMLVFGTEGHDFGVVRPTADNRLLVSVISSNREALIAINGGAAPEDVQDLMARPITYLLDGDEVVLTLDGGQPDYSSGTFTVIMSG